MAESREPNFRRGEQVPDEAPIEDNFTVGERVEVNGVSGTIDRIGGFQVRSDVSTRIMNKRRNDVRDPTNHQTGEQINLRAGSPIEIKMSNNTWVPGILLIKYYRVILDGREPAMVSHRDIRRLTHVITLPPIESRSAVAEQAHLTNLNVPAPAPTPAAPAPAASVPLASVPLASVPLASVPLAPVEDNYAEGDTVEFSEYLNSPWIPAIIETLHQYEVMSNETRERMWIRTDYVRHPTTHQLGDIHFFRVGDNIQYKNQEQNWVSGTITNKMYYVSYDGGMFSSPAVLSTLRRPAPLEDHNYRRNTVVEYHRLPTSPWVQARIEYLILYRVRTDRTGNIDLYRKSKVRHPTSHQTGEITSFRLGERVEYENDNGNWIPGTIVDKTYYVIHEGRSFPATLAQLRLPVRQAHVPATARQQRQAPPTPAAPAPAPAPLPLEQPLPAYGALAPAPAAPTQRVAVAFEIHNAFDSFKFDNFMNIIKKQSNFKNKNAPLQPLIDNVNANPKLSPEKKAELTRKLEQIFATVRQYSNYNNNRENIMNCIQYVLMQPQEFIDIYINTFITDCLKAYATGNSQSCIKGMYERIYFSFRDTVSTICLDKIQGTGAAPLCKPEYIEIFNCFYAEMPTEMLNDYAKDWVKARGEAVENLSEEARIEDFVEFVRRRVTNDANFRESERSVRKYAAANINSFMGGQRKRKKTLKKRLNPKRKSKKY